MSVAFASSLFKSIARLDRQSQNLVKQTALDFLADPSDRKFRREKLGKGMLSIRVNDDIRIIVHRLGDALTLCYADHHDDAYRWADRNTLNVNSTTGAVQIVRAETRVERIVQRVYEEPPVLERFDPEYLLALGVPPELMDAVRIVTRSGLPELIGYLPEDVMERLMDLSDGKPVPRPVRIGTSDPFLHPDASRSFRIIDSQEELRQALEYPLEQWTVFLHPSQREVVERSFSGPARVSGSAGTGKTIVALHRAAYLIRQNPSARVLLTTFSRTLVERLARQADILMGADSPNRQSLHIAHLHKIARDIYVRSPGQYFNPINSAEIKNHIDSYRATTKARQFDVLFAMSEWETVVDAWGIRDWETYRDFQRTGRGTPLGARQRVRLWRVFARVQNEISRRGKMTWNQLLYAAGRTLEVKAFPRYDHVVVDESQDFGPAGLILLRKLAIPGPNDMFLCGDRGQSIYGGDISWPRLGIDTRGRSRRLRVNYRTTRQIMRFADSVLPSETIEPDGTLAERDSICLLAGPEPEIKGFDSAAEEISEIANWVKRLTNSGYEPRDIAIFARTQADVRLIFKHAANSVFRNWRPFSRDKAAVENHVFLGTMHRAKGLEFKAVAIMGCGLKQLPPLSDIVNAIDDAERNALIERERHLLYVAASRAREHLIVTYSGDPSMFLSESRDEPATR